MEKVPAAKEGKVRLIGLLSALVTAIERATILDGVYALYDGSETIYIGKGEGAEGIKGRLKSHKGGYEGSCTKNATYFNYETSYNPSQRESELLQEYKRLWGKLPRCNDVTPSWISHKW